MLARVFTLPGCCSQLQPNLPAQYLCLFSPHCLGCGRFIFRRKGGWAWWHPSPSGSSPLGPFPDEGNLVCVAWARQQLPSASGGLKQQGEPQEWSGIPKHPVTLPHLHLYLSKAQDPSNHEYPPCPACAIASSLEMETCRSHGGGFQMCFRAGLVSHTGAATGLNGFIHMAI